LFRAELGGGISPEDGGPARVPSWSSELSRHSRLAADGMFLDEDRPTSKEHQRLFWPQVLTEL